MQVYTTWQSISLCRAKEPLCCTRLANCPCFLFGPQKYSYLIPLSVRGRMWSWVSCHPWKGRLRLSYYFLQLCYLFFWPRDNQGFSKGVCQSSQSWMPSRVKHEMGFNLLSTGIEGKKPTKITQKRRKKKQRQFQACPGADLWAPQEFSWQERRHLQTSDASRVRQ